MKQENTQEDVQADHRERDLKVNSRVLHWTAEFEFQNTVEEPSLSQTKDETTGTLCVGDIEAPATLGRLPPQARTGGKL
jgi:hypothetical protein